MKCIICEKYLRCKVTYTLYPPFPQKYWYNAMVKKQKYVAFIIQEVLQNAWPDMC